MKHNRNIYVNGQKEIHFLNKMTACCGNSKTVHVKCAIKFSRRIDSCYDCFGETYVSDSAMKLYCAQCKQKCLYCGINHNSNNESVSVILCTKCNKNWNYHMKPGCKNRYETNTANPLCIKTAMFSMEKEITYPCNVVYLH